ncbi:MAG TPA: FAD-dependent oxidoreductase, partial [Thermomicrobiales bacterium]|nr:FAD-dependent oxidoreductase [Thermomicrobiales bacterium]
MAHEIVVVGAGMVGAAVAYRLARRGARVTLIDAGEPGAGTSASSFAWYNAHQKPPRAYHDLNAAGMAEHAALAREFGAAPWYHPTGALAWATTPEGDEGLRRDAERLVAWDYPVEAVETARVTRELEPGLALDPAVVPRVWLTPGEGWIDAPALVRALVAAAREHGATVLTRSAVVGIERAGGRVGGARLADGARLAADVVVDCAGPRAAAVAALAGVALPIERVPGLLAVSAPGPAPRHICHGPEIAFRPDATGGVLMGHADTLDRTIAADTPLVPPPPACAELLARTARWWPAAGRAGLAAARIGVRPVPADGVSVVGPAPDLAGFYVAVTHSGVTLGPLLGRLVAEELVGGEAPAPLAPF